MPNPQIRTMRWKLVAALSTFFFHQAFSDQVLFDGQPTSLALWTASEVSLSSVSGTDGPVLRVEAANTQWPSAILRPDRPWDLSAFAWLEIPLRNPEAEAQTIFCRVDSAPADNNDPRAVVQRQYPFRVGAGETRRIRFFLRPFTQAAGLKPADFIGMHGTPLGGSDALWVENVKSIILFVQKPGRVRAFEIGAIAARGRAAEAWAVLPENPFPFIDRYGQFKHRDWPGKTHSEEDLKKQRRLEEADLAAHGAPETWDRFGGWKEGPTGKATGFFRAEKQEGRWTLLDPDGKPFFSHGVCCVNRGNFTPLSEREKWFEELPEASGDLGKLFRTETSTWNGYYYKGKTFQAFNFSIWNLIRKYGPDWENVFGNQSTRRLPSWGLNTIGNWSATRAWQSRKIPYTLSVETAGKTIGGGGAFGRFNDPYDPSFRALLREKISRDLAVSLKDPWCLGYFVDNELAWGDEVALALRALATPGDRKGKQAIVEELRARYEAVEALNRVWGTDHQSWEDLLASEKPPAVDKAWVDLTNFTLHCAEMYFRTVGDVIREIAPDHLYLGCRFSGFGANPLAVRAAARFADVVSFNIYEFSPSDQPLIAAVGDRPVLIGEFHFGALDRGQFHAGLSPVRDQGERAQAYANYVTECLRHPLIVGCHWFQYVDSPTTGRAGDGENYQIGFVDNADTPYPELIEVSRRMGRNLYLIRSVK